MIEINWVGEIIGVILLILFSVLIFGSAARAKNKETEELAVVAFIGCWGLIVYKIIQLCGTV